MINSSYFFANSQSLTDHMVIINQLPNRPDLGPELNARIFANIHSYRFWLNVRNIVDTGAHPIDQSRLPLFQTNFIYMIFKNMCAPHWYKILVL